MEIEFDLKQRSEHCNERGLDGHRIEFFISNIFGRIELKNSTLHRRCMNVWYHGILDL